MKKVLVTYAGGRIAIGFCRALMAAPEPIRVIGADSDKYKLHRAVADETYVIPRAKDPDFIPSLRRLVRLTRADLLWPCHEAEISAISQAGDLGIRTFLPSADVIEACQDKMATYERLAAAGLPVPRSMMVHNEEDLHRAFREYNGAVWLRATKGAGGKGALPVTETEFQTAKEWIDIYDGWSDFMAAERLTENTVTWESVWHEGNLVFAQGRRRLYWEFSHLTLSGVTGVAGALQWVSDPVVDRTAMAAVRAMTPTPHGIFSVDMTYNAQGMACVTEINIGRFMSGGVTHFYNYGVNVPYMVTQLALGERPVGQETILNPFPTDTILIHGLDVEPVVVTVQDTERLADELRETRLSLAVSADPIRATPANLIDRMK